MAFATIKARRGRLLVAAALIFGSAGALAAEHPAERAAQSAESDKAEEPELLLGDMGGLRTTLKASGVKLGISYVGEVFGNVSGGLKRGVVYDGQIGMFLNFNLEKLAGWHGARVHLHAFQINGRGPSANLVGNLMTLSGIEADRSIRLDTAWLEQKLYDERVSIRIGQILADSEFIVSETALGLVNATFGWPILTGENMTSGGPAYPLPTPGVRLQLKPTEDVTLRGAVFAGNPGGRGCTTDPQVCNPSGITFSLNGGTLWMAELEYGANQGKGAPGLPGVYKLGGWRQTGTFTDQFTDTRDRSGDWGLYAVVDQAIWRRTPGEDQGVNVWMRMGGAPSDRNLITWYVDGGFGFKGPLIERPDDVLTLGVAYGRISSDAASADRLAGPPTPVRNHETVIELNYNIKVIPGLNLQPDLQYVINPGGNVLKPSGTGTIPNALALGVRMILNL